jgi:hypothetical protein
MKFLIFACLIAPLLAAPAPKDQGPPAECEKPFGDGTLSKSASPYSFAVIATQRAEKTDYKKTFKGATIDMAITFAAPGGTSNIKGFALRAGIPFPVVQWKNIGDKQSKIVSCIAPQSIDTMVVKGTIGAKYSVAATPLLAAWANHNSLPVIYEMAIQAADGQIFVTSFNGTIDVAETDYALPKEFFQPPPGMSQNGQMDPRMRGQQQGMQGMQGMQDPRFQQQRQRRAIDNELVDDDFDVALDQFEDEREE